MSKRLNRDEQIRAMSYTIHSRPKFGEPMWRRMADGKVVPQRLIVAAMQAERDRKQGESKAVSVGG